MEDYHDLDFILAPVGGGGLLSGTLLATKYFSPDTKVVAGEPEGANDAFRSLQSGKIEQSQSNTIADGLLTTLGRADEAQTASERALALAVNPAERELLTRGLSL